MTVCPCNGETNSDKYQPRNGDTKGYSYRDETLMRFTVTDEGGGDLLPDAMFLAAAKISLSVLY